MGLFDRRRNVPDWKHEDPKVRRAAVGELSDPAVLAEIVRTDEDERVREEAIGVLHGLALEGEPEAALLALEGLGERRHLVSVARSAAHETVSRAALDRLDEARSLGSVARHGRHVPVCLAALERISDAAELGAVAQKSDQPEVALAALERVAKLYQSDLPQGIPLEEILSPVAHRARNKSAAKRARTMMSGGRPEGAETAAPQAATDRRKQTDLCERVEALAASEGTSRLAAGISEIREAWIDLLPDVDDDLADRFSRALHAARERLALNQAEQESRRKQEQQESEYLARNVTPRRELCEKAEGAQPEQAEEVLKEVRFEWERLGPLETEEGRALQQRFEAAVAQCEARLDRWRAEQTETKRLAGQEQARQEKLRLQKENRQRLEQLCTRSERLLQSDLLRLKAVARALKEVQEALADPGPLASRAEQNAMEKRLKAVQEVLAPKFRELQDREEWERWANTGVQEDLCVRTEALMQLEAPLEAARRLVQIQEQWNKASRASGDRAQEIWERFKAARDEIRSRAEAFRANQAVKKEELCVKAESLADSSEWIRTASALQALQAEWKALGPSRPSQDKALWERFRKACDAFFTRRKEDLKQRRQEMSRHREAKVALCAQAEALADSTDWQATATALKRLQVEWRAVGPVNRRESELLWQRFRKACDRFFDRYKHRDDIEREAHLAHRESLIRELEALLPPPAPAPAPVSEASPWAVETASSPGASGETEKPAAIPAGLTTILSSAVERWKQGGPVPRERASEIDERFRSAMNRLVMAYPEAVRGSAWDVTENIRKMEELCERVEGLLPQEQRMEDSSVSPGARLAAMWVEAMAANTIGGGSKDESKWRAAAEEVKKAQLLWQRIGYVPEEPRRTLAARFESACGRIPVPQEERAPAAPSRPAARRR
jgi:uncharacterized protein DUF349